MRIIFILAIVGLAISTAVHFSTYMGIDPHESVPYVWLLHIGVFVVFLPAVAVQRMLPRNDHDNEKFMSFQLAPKWMQFLTKATFVYGLVNFGVVMFLTRLHSAHKENGLYVLKDHGRLVRQITEQEYHQYRAYVVRLFSGGWMMFYAGAMTMLAAGIAYRRMAKSSGLSATIADNGRKHPPLWVHTIFAIIVQMTGFFFGPAIFIAWLMTLHPKFGCGAAVLWLATPWPGLSIAHYLLKNKLPGVCPLCGGRAFWVNNRGKHYRCQDCGWVGG